MVVLEKPGAKSRCFPDWCCWKQMGVQHEYIKPQRFLEFHWFNPPVWDIIDELFETHNLPGKGEPRSMINDVLLGKWAGTGFISVNLVWFKKNGIKWNKRRKIASHQTVWKFGISLWLKNGLPWPKMVIWGSKTFQLWAIPLPWYGVLWRMYSPVTLEQDSPSMRVWNVVLIENCFPWCIVIFLLQCKFGVNPSFFQTHIQCYG